MLSEAGSDFPSEQHHGGDWGTGVPDTLYLSWWVECLRAASGWGQGLVVWGQGAQVPTWALVPQAPPSILRV